MDADRLGECIRAGGVAVFPADTVYGLACDPEDEAAVARLYELKERAGDKPSAVMFFDRDEALRDAGARTRALLEALLPGGITAILPNPAGRYPLACGHDRAVLGIRVPAVPRLAGAPPVLQSSANLAGGPDPRRVEEIPAAIREAVDLVIDGGELHGVPSTVVDLTRFEATGEWRVLRRGAVGEDAIRAAAVKVGDTAP